MFYLVFLLINDSLNCAGRHSEFLSCLPDIAAGSVKGADMLSFPVIQLLPSASHPPHSSSFSPSSMHSPTVFPRISSQGSSSLVKICLHSWQIISQLPPLENEKSTRPEGREFLSNVHLHLFQPLRPATFFQGPPSQLDAWETFRARRQPHLLRVAVRVIQGAAGDHKMLSDPVYLAILRVWNVQVPHGRGPLMDMAHKKNVGKDHRRLFLNLVHRAAGRRSSPGSVPDSDVITSLVPSVFDHPVISKVPVGNAQLQAKVLHHIDAGGLINSLLMISNHHAVNQVGVGLKNLDSLLDLLHGHHLLLVYARPYARLRRTLDQIAHDDNSGVFALLIDALQLSFQHVIIKMRRPDVKVAQRKNVYIFVLSSVPRLYVFQRNSSPFISI